MDEAKQQEQELEEIEDNKKGFIEWVKEHKNQLALLELAELPLLQWCLDLRIKTVLQNYGCL